MNPAACHVYACLYTIAFLYIASAAPGWEATYVYNYPSAFPSVILIGTLKGGTTDLFEQLTNITVNSDAQRPEPPIRTHYEFNRTTEDTLLTSLYFPETFPEEWFPGKDKYMRYLSHLRHPCANTSIDNLRRCLSVAGLQQYTVDANAGYLRSPTSSVRLATISPFSKVIGMLREPIRGAQSLYYNFQATNAIAQDVTLNGLVDEFFSSTLQTPGMEDVLKGLANCKSVECYAMGWRELCGLGDIHNPRWTMFFGPLYSYGLAGWQQFYLKPGRALIIDSHEYYRNRSSVMEKVIYFMYGRPMTPVEAETASGNPVANLGFQRYKLTGTGQSPPWMLSSANRERLQKFYKEHLYDKFPKTLAQLREKGVWVVGFEGAPWMEVL